MHHTTKLAGIVFSVAAILFLSYPTVAQSPQANHERLKASIIAGDTPTAIRQLNLLRSANPAQFAANNYDYLLARLLERSNDKAGAAANYETTVSRKSVLAEYALWHLAQMARASGDLVQERERLRLLINSAPNSLLRDAASLRLAQSFYESQDFEGAAASLRYLIEARNPRISREARAWMGAALQKAGKTAEARDVYRRLLMQMPDASRPDDFALAAVRALDAFDSGGSASAQVAELPEAEHLLRASVYHFNRDFDPARLHYLALVQRFPQNATVANALYQVGRGFYLQQKYTDALSYFQRVLKQYPESSSARDALSFTAGAYTRLKRTDEAVAAYQLYNDKFADGPNPERPFLNIIDVLHEAGRHKEALDWVMQTRLRFRTRLGDALALFTQLRIHLAQGDWQAAVNDANELKRAPDTGGTRVAGGATPAEITFLKALALEQLGRIDEALTEYLSLPDGRSDYYGKRANQRLLILAAKPETRTAIQRRASALRSEAERLIAAQKFEEGRRSAQNTLRLTTDEANRDEVLELAARAYENLPSYKLPQFKLVPLGRLQVLVNPTGEIVSHNAIANELMFLGLYDEGTSEYVLAKSDATAKQSETPSSPNEVAYSLAVYQLQGGHADRAVRFGEQVWKGMPGDYLFELAPRELVDLLYPLPFRESLLKHAPPRGIDPRFVISIARQESRFQPDAKSVAAARGLMQFISETALATATGLGMQNLNQDELYNPDTAILFGSEYLASLFKQFPAQPQAVAASYNGGPENVARWVGRSRSNDPDRYVSEVGFAQTKDYVFKVMTNFWQYERMYDEKLERR